MITAASGHKVHETDFRAPHMSRGCRPGRMRLFAYILIIFFGLSLLLGGCSDGFPPEFPAADFSLKAPLTGKEVSLESLKGRPIIIYWFASW